MKWSEVLENPDIVQVRLDILSPVPSKEWPRDNLWVTLDGERKCLGNDGILFAFDGYRTLDEYKKIIEAIEQEAEKNGWRFDPDVNVDVKGIKTRNDIEKEKIMKKEIKEREEWLAENWKTLPAGKVTFKTVGWPGASHECSHNWEIPGNWTVLCDICPECWEIADDEPYRGDGRPTILDIVENIEETHGSMFHGAMPVRGARAPDEVQKLIKCYDLHLTLSNF